MDKLTKAKIQMILDHPFFASLALNMAFIEDNSIPTACTDGHVIKYNSKFISTLTKEEIIGVLVHEVMHVAYLHHLRRGNRDGKKFNIAADYAINQLILEAGVRLPSGALIERKYANMSAEDIYAILPDQNDTQVSLGEVEDGIENDATDSEISEEEQRVKMMISSAAQSAMVSGKLPAGLKRFVDEFINSKVNWREVLARFITDKTSGDYSWTKPNRRYSRVILPGMDKQDSMGSIALIVDTSASIDNKLLNEFASEIDSIKQMVSKEVIVLYVDTEVAEVQTFEFDDEVKLTPKGGGGTSFKPGFEYLENNNIECSCVVYFTDGYCDRFPDNSQWAVLWAVYNNKNFNAPFGEIVNL
jgi:predicted metal-dependent peptidase